MYEDCALTEEQRACVGALSKHQIRLFDAKLLSTSRSRWQKVAYVVGVTMSELTDIEGIPDTYFLHRIRSLVNEGILESAGDLKHLRYCEVRAVLRGA